MTFFTGVVYKRDKDVDPTEVDILFSRRLTSKDGEGGRSKRVKKTVAANEVIVNEFAVEESDSDIQSDSDLQSDEEDL